MTKFATSVRFLVKDGEVQGFFAKTGDRTFVAVKIFENEQVLINARVKMIGNLDKIRKHLKEILPELGVTDPVSGPVFCET